MAKIVDWQHFWISLISKVVAVIIVIVIILYTGIILDHQNFQWTPDYAQQSLDEIILKTELSNDDYELIYKQTGVTKIGVDNLLKTDKMIVLKDLQKQLFNTPTIEPSMFAPFVCQHDLDEPVKTVPLENGDIIITDTTHFSFFTIGHAAIVVDAKNGLILNAIGYGSKSQITSIDEITNRPNIMVLRPQLSKQQRQDVADYALSNLHNKDYSLTVGIFGNKLPEDIQQTHCSHMIWAAYQSVGLDLDGNGGKIVMPMDLAKSENVDIIQIYGFDLNLYK